jgi:hypothetical protein
MSKVLPFVRHMILCEDVQPTPSNPLKVNLFGLADTFRVASTGTFPVKVSFCVYVLMTEGRGAGQGRVVVSYADTDEMIFVGHTLPIQFGTDPLEVRAAVIRIKSCSFPKAGLYTVEFRYNGISIAEEPLLVEHDL